MTWPPEIVAGASPLLIAGTTLAVCFVSAILPLVNAELYVLALGAAAPRGLFLPIVIAAAAGQMLGKAVMYFAGRGIYLLPAGWLKRKLEIVERKAAAHRTAEDLTLVASAIFGIPPLYVMSVACGMLHYDLARFMAICFAGRTVHFAAIFAFPHLVRGTLV
jgi:membrane protein YqaA with SNARE-associated domain